MPEIEATDSMSGGFGATAPESTTQHSGRITETIGTGENARNSIVWMTITWSFFIASAMTLLFFALVVCYKDFQFVDHIKSVWSIFVPIITLALGYAFGKSQ